jgi:hypothetical protein
MHSSASRAVVDSGLSCLVFEHFRTGAGPGVVWVVASPLAQEPVKHASLRLPGDNFTNMMVPNVIPSVSKVTARSVAILSVRSRIG